MASKVARVLEEQERAYDELMEAYTVFFRSLVEAPKHAREQATIVRSQWRTLPLDDRVAIAKFADWFESTVSEQKLISGPMLLMFQKHRRAAQVENADLAVDTFRFAVNAYLEAASDLRRAVDDALAEDERRMSIIATSEFHATMSEAHEQGKRELDSGLGRLYTGEDFWESNTA